MNKNFQQKDFAKMSNEELCAIAARLKFQLVEARFKMSSGEIEKISVISQIRKTIAKVFTELTNRGFKVSIGSHGVTMYDLANNNKPISIDPAKIQELADKENAKKAKKAPAKTEAKKEPAKEVAKEVKKEPAKEVAKEVKQPEAKPAEEKKGENK